MRPLAGARRVASGDDAAVPERGDPAGTAGSGGDAAPTPGERALREKYLAGGKDFWKARIVERLLRVMKGTYAEERDPREGREGARDAAPGGAPEAPAPPDHGASPAGSDEHD